LVYNEVPVFSVIAERSLDASHFASSSISFLRAQRRRCHRPPPFPRHQRHLLLHFTPRVTRLLSCSSDALYNQPQHHGTLPLPRVLSSLSTPSRRVPPTPRHDVFHVQWRLHFIPGRLASLRICSTSLRANLSPCPRAMAAAAPVRRGQPTSAPPRSPRPPAEFLHFLPVLPDPTPAQTPHQTVPLTFAVDLPPPPLRPPRRPGRPAAPTPRRSLQQDHITSRKLLDHLTEPLRPPACRNIATMTKPDRHRPKQNSVAGPPPTTQLHPNAARGPSLLPCAPPPLAPRRRRLPSPERRRLLPVLCFP
jgi:hypothetical protein